MDLLQLKKTSYQVNKSWNKNYEFFIRPSKIVLLIEYSMPKCTG